MKDLLENTIVDIRFESDYLMHCWLIDSGFRPSKVGKMSSSQYVVNDRYTENWELKSVHQLGQ